MYKINVLNNIAVQGLESFSGKAYEVGNDAQDPDAILLRSSNIHDMKFSPSLKAIGRAGVGVNNIPVDNMSNLGVPVFNSPGANANAVKELVIVGMLLASRNIPQALNFVSQLNGDEKTVKASVESGKKQFVGRELAGQTLGVIGLGAIGVRVANVALQLDMDVIGYDPDISVQRAWQLSSAVEQAESIDEVLQKSDFISIHVPLLESTTSMISEQHIAMMKDKVILLNFSRQEVIDQNAIFAALENKKLRSYVSDFPSVKLKSHQRVIALPHLGASTVEAEQNCAVMVCRNVREYLEDGNIRSSVNFPNAVLRRRSGERLAIANSNVPNMVGQVSTLLAENNLNIIDMLNRSRGDLAYTIVDVDGKITPELIKQIKDIEGILSIRNL